MYGRLQCGQELMPQEHSMMASWLYACSRARAAAASRHLSLAAASAVWSVCCRLKEPVLCRLSETGEGEESFLVAGWNSSRYSVLTSWQPSPDLSDLAPSS